MAASIIEAVSAKLNYPVPRKVDPNFQEPRETPVYTEERFAQAAIPSVLAGLFSFTRTDEGCNYILAGGGSKSWLEMFFGNRKKEAVEKIAQYAGLPEKDAKTKMEKIAGVAVAVAHEANGEKINAEKLKAYLAGERHHILVHLPAVLQFGYLLNDNSLDDRTNKMEGPISNLMHSIENKFSGGGS